MTPKKDIEIEGDEAVVVVHNKGSIRRPFPMEHELMSVVNALS